MTTICFGPFALNLDARQLTRGGDSIHLSTKAFDLLAALVRERPNVVSKDALQQRLWPDTFVAEANLSNLIGEVRDALGDSPRDPLYIRTVHRVGYAFCGETAREHAGPALYWLEWGSQRFPLHAGEHVIGRDPDAAIRIDASTVSRRHARIVVGGSGVVLEDFGSKNGTFHGDVRVTSPVAIADGDRIRIGSQLLTLRVRAADSTETHVDWSR
ncbi:MAG TPA: FHA domain-containing protein [Vicinamibacterales bacterium]|nr:FHA domain-containing protein [Vicinamibacterales bacterium]